MKTIATALVKAQMEMGNAIKDSANPFFKSKYADLNSIREACIPSLNKHGIVVLQPLTSIDGKNYVKTLLLHESGESIESLTEIIYNKQNDAQAQGSGITYARRYGLQSLVCIGADDDDGNKASNKVVIQQDVSSATDEQINYIDSLIRTCSYSEEIKVFIENNCRDFSYQKAQECIEKLKLNQLDPIQSGMPVNQTQIKEKLKTIK